MLGDLEASVPERTWCQSTGEDCVMGCGSLPPGSEVSKEQSKPLVFVRWFLSRS